MKSQDNLFKKPLSPPVYELRHSANCPRQRVSGFIFFFMFYITLHKICLKPPLISSQFYLIREWAGATLFGQVSEQVVLRAVQDSSSTQVGAGTARRTHGSPSVL